VADAPRVLYLAPDVPGGMGEAMRGLLASPLAKRYRIEVVPTHLGPGAVQRLTVYLGSMLRLTWWSLRGRGRIVHIHATVRGSMYRKAILVLLARALRRRVVFHVHSGPGDIATFRAGLGGLSLALFRLALREASVVLAVSGASAAALERAYGAARVVIVPNVAPPGPDEVPAKGLPGVPLAVYLGGFANPVKGGEVLIGALAGEGIPGLRVMLAGPGELPEEGRRLVEEGRAVEWRAWLDAAERDAALRAAEIFVLASTSEGLPMALLEAMSYGLAIVATEVGGVPDVVAGDSEALLVAPGNTAALRQALSRLAGDPALRARLGGAAREAAERFGPAEVADRVDVLYRTLL
jgi:glycosyltransferase involved in cell wall biosynthesis